MLEEALRVRRYLHPFTYQRIELECHSWLICEENINFINDLCSEIVQREQWQGSHYCTPCCCRPVYAFISRFYEAVFVHIQADRALFDCL